MADAMSAWCKVCLVGVFDREGHLKDVHGYETWSTATLFQMFDPSPRDVIDGDQRLL